MNSFYISVEAQFAHEFKIKQLKRNEGVFIQSEINYTRRGGGAWVSARCRGAAVRGRLFLFYIVKMASAQVLDPAVIGCVITTDPNLMGLRTGSDAIFKLPTLI